MYNTEMANVVKNAVTTLLHWNWALRNPLSEMKEKRQIALRSALLFLWKKSWEENILSGWKCF